MTDEGDKLVAVARHEMIIFDRPSKRTSLAMIDHIEQLQSALAKAEAERDGAYDRAAEVAEKNAEDDWTDGVPQGGIIADTIRQLKGQHHD
jgi:hypothetical protein